MIFKHTLAAVIVGTLFLLDPGTSKAQINITELGRLDYQAARNSDLSNLWGYTDEEGNEYAIVGVNGNSNDPGGVAVVDVTDPANPVELFFFPGPASIWREIKVYNDHAYVTTEANSGGLTIVDLSPLPQSTALPATVWQAPDWETSHSLFIDENGRLYVFGSSRGVGGAIMYDITGDPMVPVEVGAFEQWYVHDGYARGDTLYAGHIYDGFFSIVDVSDPAAPVLLGTQATPNNFTHNVWLDDSGDHLYTTDERTDSYVGSYDISDPTDILYEDQLQSDPGSGTIPHNTYWLDHYVVTSYYTYGVVIYDVTHPNNMIEVGHYDTSPNFQGDGFNGDWGVYPYFPSGNLICSDIERGLVILGPDYQRGCYLEGMITNANTSAPVGQATVIIEGLSVSDITEFDGNYATGYYLAGTYQVTVSAPGYVSQTLDNVVLVNGQITDLDVALVPLVSFALQGSVVDELTNDPVPNAQVLVYNDAYAFTATSDASGMFELSAVYSDDYDVLAGAWGWHTVCPSTQSINTGTGVLTIQLPSGYYDDFALDLGWDVETNGATAGIWERGFPIGTDLQGNTSNPDVDVSGDCSGQAYVTGNGGGGAGDDDVDDGSTSLVSPEFDASNMIEPHVRYSRWFFNAGGSGTPNDQMQISLDNGLESVEVELITAQTAGMGSWQSVDIRISDFLVPTANMQLRVLAADDAQGHLVEGGLDVFEVVDTGIDRISDVPELEVYVRPNPSNGQFDVRSTAINATARLLDATGREMIVPIRSLNGMWTINADHLRAGTYLLVIEETDGGRSVQRVVLQ
ncbi:MAG: choice-of-anchor B family protein [Flavobacteriales bacterium]|nr:choice-of-anchor B family protein [Flavobacteriales bacterium]MBK6944899.1 choice-of-anchor B family protein [Flavobacteriales bacterium]MBK9535547.1 choice-of-anchor B family protein [Flavobacteriales bacterium]MBP9138923.1 choice-of-anchor B family protein [Flavobacteriales bacterium]HQV52344.1 choice-of-anchor B family protein [Flavobacteriales bacterium]